MHHLPSTILYTPLSEAPDINQSITMEDANQIFNYFKSSKLFKWSDGHNNCENRANAISILLDFWGIPNYKGWVFSGYFLKKNLGSLINSWNFHVAALLPVKSQDTFAYYMIDPSTSQKLETIENWALQITLRERSFYFIKPGNIYIFPQRNIERYNWHKRNRRNLNWTIQGLCGINGRSQKGKAYLTFNKKMVKNTREAFEKMKIEKPVLC